jgi:hypothetical protein
MKYEKYKKGYVNTLQHTKKGGWCQKILIIASCKKGGPVQKIIIPALIFKIFFYFCVDLTVNRRSHSHTCLAYTDWWFSWHWTLSADKRSYNAKFNEKNNIEIKNLEQGVWSLSGGTVPELT